MTSIENAQNVVNHLLSHREKKPSAIRPLFEEQILLLCHAVTHAFLADNSLLEIEAPIVICGDTHGQFSDLLRIFEFLGYPPKTRYLFLGDYVDRGSQSIETICLLYAMKLLYPDHVYLLRGNHEDASLNRVYGFYDECKRKYNVKMWRTFVDSFNALPVAALVSQKILCMHGGLSPKLDRISQINSIKRPCKIPETGIMCDLLWADPEKDLSGWEDNDRGISFIFGADEVKAFVKRNNIDLVCRAHQVVEDGYEFFADRSLITIFSAPNYNGEFDNCAGMLVVDKDLTCSIRVLAPAERGCGSKKDKDGKKDKDANKVAAKDDKK